MSETWYSAVTLLGIFSNKTQANEDEVLTDIDMELRTQEHVVYHSYSANKKHNEIFPVTCRKRGELC